MAYTLPNTGIIRPWDHSKNRYIHRRLVMTIGGSGVGGGSTGTASIDCSIPCPGRLVAYSFGLQGAGGVVENGITGGTLVLKAETTAGATILSNASMGTEVLVPTPLGTVAKDEAGGATDAADGFSGGFPVRGGVFASISGGTDTEIVVVDLWFRLCTWVKLELIAQSGADGTGAVTRSIPLGNAGVLSAFAIDYQNISSGTTCDILVKADSTDGPTLLTVTDNVTDFAPSLLGTVGKDEAKNASAATDGTESGNAFRTGLFVDVAQSDVFTSGNEKIIVEFWIDD